MLQLFQEMKVWKIVLRLAPIPQVLVFKPYRRIGLYLIGQ